VELLLVVSLVLMLVSALVFNFSNLMRGNQLEEGTVRLETLMRFARAQAANSGRKVQLVFGSESTNTLSATNGEVRATWEPDPLGQPGCFSDLSDAQWHVQEINDLVQVESVKLLDSTTAKPAASGDEEEAFDDGVGSAPVTPIAPITFYPDGSSDSAEIIVSAKSPEEDQRMAVRLVGITGSISHQLVTADTDEMLADSSSHERPAQSHRETILRDNGVERDRSPSLLSPRLAGSSRTVQNTAPRATVGDTNTVDRGD
jgi:hypothetical protein